MIPEEVWKSATRKAWLVGLALGLLGGIVSAAVGAFSGLCCLFQFANAFMPFILGLAGGGIGAATAKWAEFPPGGGAATGAKLGVRAGGLAAMLGGFIGFLFTLLWPIVMTAVSALNSQQDVMETVISSVAVLAMGAVTGFAFALVGTFGGILAAAGAGAVGGLVFGKK